MEKKVGSWKNNIFAFSLKAIKGVNWTTQRYTLNIQISNYKKYLHKPVAYKVIIDTYSTLISLIF